MKHILLSAILGALFSSTLVFSAPSPAAPPIETGESTWAKKLHIQTSGPQDTTPVQQLDLYLSGFHIAPNQPAIQEEAHYYCQQQTQEFAQCVIYSGNGADARLVGVEYIVSSRLFQTLPKDERHLWHPHTYEVQAGLVIAPGLPQTVEHSLMEKLASTYGKGWHLWQGKDNSLPVGHAAELPIGQAFLMMGPSKDGQIAQSLIEERDRRFNVSATELRQQRADITPADAYSQKEQRLAAADPPGLIPEPLPPTLPAPPQSDLPTPPDQESEPFARERVPDVPSPAQPAPAEPGLPQPPMPEPAKPGLPPPPMPQPAEPPALSVVPGTEPPSTLPEQEPATPPVEPTALSADRARRTGK